MTVRVVEWKKPYRWGKWIEIDENKVISLKLRDENNLIIWDEWDNEIYVDLQLPDEVTPTEVYPVWVNVWRAVVDNWWDFPGTIVCFKTTSWDNIKLFYADDGKLYIDNWTWTFKQIYLKGEVDALLQALRTYVDEQLALKQDKLIAWDRITINADWKTINADSQVSDTAYWSSWDWVTTIAPSKNAVYDKINSIDTLIPSAAAANNQLADKNYVDDSINQVAAYYITKNAQWDAFATYAELSAATVYYSWWVQRTPTRNDFCMVLADETHSWDATRYSYQNSQWEYQYTINNAPMTQAQVDAINSGITAGKVSTYDGYANTIAWKQDQLTAWTNINIDPNTNVISSTAPTYSAWDWIDIDANNEISVDASDLAGNWLVDDGNNNLAIDTSVVATQNDISNIRQVPSWGTAWQVLKKNANGFWWWTDDNTTYSAWAWLSLSWTEFSVDTTVIATKADLENLSGFEVVDTLPSLATAKENTLYFLGPIWTWEDRYEEWIVKEVTPYWAGQWTIYDVPLALDQYGRACATWEITQLSDLSSGGFNVYVWVNYTTSTGEYTNTSMTFGPSGSHSYWTDYNTVPWVVTIAVGAHQAFVPQNVMIVSWYSWNPLLTYSMVWSESPISWESKAWVKVWETSVNFTAWNWIAISNGQISANLAAWNWITITWWITCVTESDRKWPCPSGFHIPTYTEWDNICSYLTAMHLTHGEDMEDYLHLPMAWYRRSVDGSEYDQGYYGMYWTSSFIENAELANTLVAYNWWYNMGSSDLACWCPIRAFKNEYVAPDSTWTASFGVLGSEWIFWNQTEWLISITPDWVTWYTIMDKNLGATTVHSYLDTLSEASCGKYYQRWNDNWFAWTWTITTSSTQVDASTYGPQNNYSSSTFIIWYPAWDTSENADLWWDVSNWTYEVCTWLTRTLTISATGWGDVVWPSSATNGHLAVFDGTTGKLIKDWWSIPVTVSSQANNVFTPWMKIWWGTSANHSQLTPDANTAYLII